MKARNRIFRSGFIAMGVLGLALSGTALADSQSDLRAALKADAGDSIQQARSELQVSRSALNLEIQQAFHGELVASAPVLPVVNAPCFIAEADTDSEDLVEDENVGETAQSGHGQLSGLVVYSGNR